MNADRILELANHLESLPPSAPRFNMSRWWEVDDCGTAACIAGHAVHLFDPKATIDLDDTHGYIVHPEGNADDWSNFFNYASAILGLNETTATRLFYASGLGTDLVKRCVAVHVLRTLAETGEVDWINSYLYCIRSGQLSVIEN